MTRVRHHLLHIVFGATPFPFILVIPIVMLITGTVYGTWWAGIILGGVNVVLICPFGYLMGRRHASKPLYLSVVVADTPEHGLAEHLRSRGVPEEVVQSAREQLKFALVDAARRRETE